MCIDDSVSKSNSAIDQHYKMADPVHSLILEVESTDRDEKRSESTHSTKRGWWSRLKAKRQFLLVSCLALATITLIVNIFGTIYLPLRYAAVPFPGSDRFVYRGSCRRAESINSAFHVLINILSTLLLSASNLGMQLLVAPTRAQIDQLHAKKHWLDIGVPSFRNLKHVGWTRRFLWILFVLSSLPLHFL